MLFDKNKNKEKAAILKKKCALLTLKYQNNAQHQTQCSNIKTVQAHEDHLLKDKLGSYFVATVV